jgi:tetratricopeptide (TPR) repeat protein
MILFKYSSWKLLCLSTAAIVLLLMGYTKIREQSPGKADQETYRKIRKKISLAALRCGPDWSDYQMTTEEIQNMIPLPGTGSHVWKINSSSDSAQFYFNQGINLYYGFHIPEALPSFKKALSFDSTTAILYWAVALAYGPNINDAVYVASKDALLAVSQAKLFMNSSSEKERGLIDAMESHYSPDSTRERAALNQDYADKMKSLYIKYPTDAEIGTLYADALMNLHPWDLWQHDGRPKPWTPELISVLENVLTQNPEHPGANHYYIHTMEASPFASKAKASAERLGRLAPGLSHMVHMPSHIYIRTGEYDKGVKVNEAAVKNYYVYKRLFPAAENNVFLYEYHNRHMQAACSMNTNNYSRAIKDALDCRNAIDKALLSLEDPMGNYAQYMYMTPELTMISFQKWNDILLQPSISKRFHYGALIQEFARGMAYANTGNPELAKSSLAIMESLLIEKNMSVVLAPFNAPVTGATVAKYILMGTIAEKENHMAQAVYYFTKGTETEDSMVYQEPRDWLVPARHYLGHALLKEKKYEEAEKVFLEDLSYQPDNYISTTGLRKARQK